MTYQNQNVRSAIVLSQPVLIEGVANICKCPKRSWVRISKEVVFQFAVIRAVTIDIEAVCNYFGIFNVLQNSWFHFFYWWDSKNYIIFISCKSQTSNKPLVVNFGVVACESKYGICAFMFDSEERNRAFRRDRTLNWQIRQNKRLRMNLNANWCWPNCFR